MNGKYAGRLMAGPLMLLSLLTAETAFAQQYTITTLAASGTSAAFSGQTGMAADNAGSAYVTGFADPLGTNHFAIFKVNTAGVTLAVGSTQQYPPYPGCGGPAANVLLTNPGGVAIDNSGNLYVTQAGGGPTLRISGGTVNCLLGPNGPWGVGIAADDAGNAYISQPAIVYQLTSSGAQRTVVGDGTPGCTGGKIQSPQGLALDGAGNLYIADSSCNVIWKLTPTGGMTVAAGNGTLGFSGDGLLATSASLNKPTGVAVDASGNLYIADWANNRIRKVTAGVITTIAGNGDPGYTGDGGPAVSAELSGPWGIAVGAGGTVYFNDQGKYDAVIRRLTPNAPKINAGGIVNAASFQAPITRGALATIFGSNLAGGYAQAYPMPVPTTLGGVQVMVDGNAAPLFYVSPYVINFQVPFEAPASGNVAVVVLRDGSPSPVENVAMADYAPAVFTYPGDATNTRYPVIMHQDNTLVTPTNPATANEYLSIYATGVGSFDHPPATGAQASASPLARVSVLGTIHVGVNDVAKILFAGLTPGSLGMLQINIQLPADLPASPAGYSLGLSMSFDGGNVSPVVPLFMH